MTQEQAVDHLSKMVPKPRRRWRLWLGGALLLSVLWVVILYVFFIYWTDRRLREAMAAA
jgi:hypothetical protein